MKPDFADGYSLYTQSGSRKYLNGFERQRVLAVSEALKPAEALFVAMLAWTGARVSEVLALTASSFQVDCGIVAITTLKRRRHHVRELPISPDLMDALDHHFDLRSKQRNPSFAHHRLWPWSRTTAWRLVKRVMRAAGLFGAHACPKGLRHAFGVATLGIVPPNIRQKWLGHARPETTNIYSAVCGPDEFGFAEQFWRAKTDHR